MRRHIREFLGPIFTKEAIEIARRGRYYLCRTLFGVALLLIMYIVWEESNHFARAGIISSMNSLAYMASMVFTAASWMQYWAVWLLVPAFLCGVIAGEREEHTLDLLFITPLSDREIVLGKLFSRIAVMVCVILCAVPVVSLLMLFGGISPESIWRVLAATLLAIFFTGSHAIYFSTITKTPMEALARTYVASFMWLAGLAILAWGFRELIQTLERALPAEDAQSLRTVVLDYLSPVYLIYPLVSFWGAVNESFHGSISFIYGGWAWPISFVFPALWSVFLCRRAVKRLRELPKTRVSWTKSLRWRRRVAPVATTDGTQSDAGETPKMDSRRRRRAHTWFGRSVDNPLWLRARLAPVYDRFGSISRLVWLGWIIVIFALVMVAIVKPTDLATDGCSILFQAPTWAILGLVICLVSGHSLIGDRRRGFLEQVIVTPLTGREIIDGTFLALWEHLRRLIWLPLGLGLFFCITGGSTVSGTLVAMVTGFLFCLVLIWHSLACSLAARTTPGAVVAAFLLPVTIVIVLPVVVLSFGDNYPPALWTIAGASLAVFWAVSRVKLNAATVGLFLAALHVALVALASAWTREPRSQFPLAAMHPFFFLTVLLANADRSMSVDALWDRYWLQIVMCYWAGLVVHIALLRWWAVRQFDRMVERAPSRSVRHAGESASAEPPSTAQNRTSVYELDTRPEPANPWP